MSIFRDADPGVKPGSGDPRPYPVDCDCAACLAEANRENSRSWLAAVRIDPVDPLDRIWESGYSIGLLMEPALPPGGLAAAGVKAWFSGYQVGIEQARCEVLRLMDELYRDLASVRARRPIDSWHEAEIAAARSNGGHPNWEN